MLIWPRMEAEFHGGSSHTQGTSTIKKVVALVSDDASAQMTTLNMSSGSYSGICDARACPSEFEAVYNRSEDRVFRISEAVSNAVGN